MVVKYGRNFAVITQIRFLACALFVLPAVHVASAQFGGFVIKDARVLVGDGTELETASIAIQGANIMQVGKSVRSNPMARTIDAAGRYVTPGLIDVWGSVAVGGTGGGSAAGLAHHNFDRYDRHAIEAALRQGVTSMYVGPVGEGAANGIGSVVRLLPGGGEEDVVLAERCALGGVMGGATGQGALARAKAFHETRQALIRANDYRESLDAYEEDLEEYVKEIKKRAKEAEKADGDKSGGEKDGKKKGGDNGGKQPKKGQKDSDTLTAAAFGDDAKAPERPRRRGRPGGGGGEKAKGEKGKDAKKDDGPKKPDKPARDSTSETLLRVIDGEIRWRVTAHRSADILNAIDVAEEFNLPLVIEGGAGAWRVAAALADADVPVILNDVDRLAFFEGPGREADPRGVATLLEAGVDVYIGSGPGGGTAHLSLLAARLERGGMSRDDAIAAVTGEAAELLGVGSEVGRVAAGMKADLVIWSGHPFDPAARVERVFVNGNEVYEAKP